ncbi:GPW/gp25 family protein [Larkinella rosea]|uniref:IraD/Gp25-like domain-containing protein n=1 Tax=Larkinella rosea TaxID=2025312 RepID=A0A3P1C304_9BACT|nr:GPW/gp25 family protein [Larkinella rosea]RRB07761.1 hypothetical protein EHT25_08300 [Larkinella rosea]
MDPFEQTFLGRGWAFPPEFNPVSGQAKMLSNEEDIQSSLKILLATRVGERIMQPSFGCNLDIMLFEPISTTLKARVKDLVFTAIYNYEPRIRPLSVSLIGKDEDGIVEVEVEYEVKATNSRYNLVYPFYLNEGV